MKKLKLETGVGAAQWLVFLLANTLTLPIIVGQVFNLTPPEISGLIQRSFLVVGLSSLLTGGLGHRLPIPDCPAGIWAGVFIIMGQIANLQGIERNSTFQLLEGGMLLTGFILIVLGVTGWISKILKLFTPLVNGVFLITLSLTLSGTFLKGMIGANDSSLQIQPVNIAIAFGVFVLVIAFSIWGKGWLKNYAVLIGIIVGWVFFGLINGFGSIPEYSSIISIPEIFAWGAPRLDMGMFISSILVALMVTSNIIASVSAMLQVFRERELITGQTQGRQISEESRLKNGGIACGISNVLSSLFSTVGTVPYAIASGFVRMTGQSRMAPFIIACLVLIGISLFPGAYSLLSLLPGPVANAAILASFTQLLGLGIISLFEQPLEQRRVTIIGISLTMASAVVYLPQSIFASFPTVLQYIVSNGVMVGIIIAILMEQIWREKRKIQSDQVGNPA